MCFLLAIIDIFDVVLLILHPKYILLDYRFGCLWLVELWHSLDIVPNKAFDLSCIHSAQFALLTSLLANWTVAAIAPLIIATLNSLRFALFATWTSLARPIWILSLKFEFDLRYARIGSELQSLTSLRSALFDLNLIWTSNATLKASFTSFTTLRSILAIFIFRGLWIRSNRLFMHAEYIFWM